MSLRFEKSHISRIWLIPNCTNINNRQKLLYICTNITKKYRIKFFHKTLFALSEKIKLKNLLKVPSQFLTKYVLENETLNCGSLTRPIRNLSNSRIFERF